MTESKAPATLPDVLPKGTRFRHFADERLFEFTTDARLVDGVWHGSHHQVRDGKLTNFEYTRAGGTIIIEQPAPAPPPPDALHAGQRVLNETNSLVPVGAAGTVRSVTQWSAGVDFDAIVGVVFVAPHQLRPSAPPAREGQKTPAASCEACDSPTPNEPRAWSWPEYFGSRAPLVCDACFGPRGNRAGGKSRLEATAARIAENRRRQSAPTPETKPADPYLYGIPNSAFGLTRSDSYTNWPPGAALPRDGTFCGHCGNPGKGAHVCTGPRAVYGTKDPYAPKSLMSDGQVAGLMAEQDAARAKAKAEHTADLDRSSASRRASLLPRQAAGCVMVRRERKVPFVDERPAPWDSEDT